MAEGRAARWVEVPLYGRVPATPPTWPLKRLPTPGASTDVVHDTLHRSSAAILGLAFERNEPDRSALAIQAESLIVARSVQTAIDRPAGFTTEVINVQCIRWLDALVDQGHRI